MGLNRASFSILDGFLVFGPGICIIELGTKGGAGLKEFWHPTSCEKASERAGASGGMDLV